MMPRTMTFDTDSGPEDMDGHRIDDDAYIFLMLLNVVVFSTNELLFYILSTSFLLGL